MWHEVPELVLRNIFCKLEASDLCAASLTCRLWNSVASEDIIWKQLIQRLWKISKDDLPPGKVSWRNEYRRLTNETPTQLSETLQEHTDEVLDVSFSHDGKLFCTTSKDATVKVWELGFPTKVKHNAKMLLLAGWNLTQYSTFNKSDTYLCVCGVQFGGNVNEYFPSSSGRAAIFRTSDFALIQTMKTEPPQLFADWYDDETVLGGYVEENQTLLHIKAFKVAENAPFDLQEPDCGQIVYSFDTDHHHTMTLLVAELPCSHQSHDQSCDNQHPKKSQTSRSGKTDSISACCCDKLSKYMIFVSGQHSALSIHDVTDLHKRMNSRNVESQPSSRKTQNCTKGLKSASGKTGKQRWASGGILEKSSQRDRSQNAARWPRNSASHPEAFVLDKPTFVPSFDKYYISGMKLSPDHRELYFNYRICHQDKFDEEGYPMIESDLSIDRFNLVTKSHSKKLLSGHKAFSNYPAWYICLDICQDYIVSGSEDGRAFLWDKHYLCFLGNLQHSLNSEIVINGTTFCPTDNECVVTGGDDGIVHVWRSRRQHAECLKQNKMAARRHRMIYMDT